MRVSLQPVQELERSLFGVFKDDLTLCVVHVDDVLLRSPWLCFLKRIDDMLGQRAQGIIVCRPIQDGRFRSGDNPL